MYYRLWHEQFTDENNGTVHFQAPEQMYPMIPSSPRGTDVFQIGIIMTCLMREVT
jgi:serine/threonine protein kinase